MLNNAEDKKFSKNYRSFLEGEHIWLQGDEGVSDVHEFLNRVKKEHVRRLAIVEDGIFYQQYGVGYYQGNVTRMKKELDMLLEDVNRRRFVDRLILVDVVDKLTIESMCILKELVARRVQLVIVSMYANEMNVVQKYCFDELKDAIEKSASMGLREPRARRG